MPPAYAKTILCLANSRKMSGRCIAGREVLDGAVFGPWVRPVSEREHAEISEEERRFENGQFPAVLDIVEVPLKKPLPLAFQTENHLIDDAYYWMPIRTVSWAEAQKAVDAGRRPLWGNFGSSYNGVCDRVPVQSATPADGSLRLIEVGDLEIHVQVEGAAFGNGKQKVRGQFTHENTQYLLAITDPRTESRYLQGQDGIFAVGRALFA
jgi:hypothetical protein